MSRGRLAFVALVTCAIAATARAQQPAPSSAVPVLPRPTGPYTVGTTSFRLTDERRTDTLGDSPAARQVVVHLWYPAVNGATGATAPYLREGLAEARTFATLLRQPEGALDYLADIRTSAVLDAPPRTGERLPLLVFSHGYTAMASSYTALLADLASHGYAIASVVHPHEAMAATLADGQAVTVLDGQKQMRKAIRDVLGEWAREDETMAAVTRAPDEATATTVMRGYLDALPTTTQALQRWVDDTLLTVDRLGALPAGPASRVAARLDVTRVGAFGHSMGGVTAAAYCAADRRCRAGLNLDGIPQYGSLIDTPLNRPFLMVYSGREGRLGASDVIYRRAAKPYRRVDVSETLHNDFSDMILWGGPLASRPIFGKRPADQSVAITRQIVREFFDQELQGRASPLLSGRTSLSGVTIR